MKIAIIGAGAVGGYFGAEFIEAGADVTFVARGETLEQLQTRGLVAHSPEGERTLQVNVVEDLSQIPEADIVFLATKTLNGVELPAALPDGAVLITTQNSVEMPAIAMDTYGPDRVIPGVVRSFLVHDGPGIARYTGGVLSFTFGAQCDATQGVAKDFEELLARTAIKPINDPNVVGDVWAKAMFVTCFGAFGAMLNLPLGPLRTTYRENLRDLMTEVEEIARANNVDLPDDIVDKNMAFTDEQPADSTSSMQRDITDGLPNELDAQVGAIIRMGERAGVPARMHKLVYNTITHREEK